MTEATRIEKDQYWTIGFMIVIIITLNQYRLDVQMALGCSSVLASGLLGAVGGALGALIAKGLEEFEPWWRILALFLVVGGIIATFSLWAQSKEDSAIVQQAWHKQEIGDMIFETPAPLTLISEQIPENTAGFYGSVELYANANLEDNNYDRLIFAINSELLLDSIDLLESFVGSLESGLENIDFSSFKLLEEHSYQEKDEILSRFVIEVDGELLQGMGFAWHQARQRTLQSLWLVPVSRGFSDVFIEKVESSIVLQVDEPFENF